MKKISYSLIVLVLVNLLILACKNNRIANNENEEASSDHPSQGYNSSIDIISPLPGYQYTAGDEIFLSITNEDSLSGKPDSIEIYLDEKIYATILTLPSEMKISSSNLKMGNHPIKLIVYKNGNKDYKQTNFILISDIQPKEIKYTIVNTYKHDINAYTQGLVYDNGYLYEGTGHKGQSSLRKVEISSGEVINLLKLSNTLFGEGIAILNNRIFQLTWKSQIGFVYDKESFQLLQKIYFQNREGWGLTNNNDHFFMSDGTSNIYLCDTSFFNEIGKIEVYNNTRSVGMLNELEYINGKIFSNIYGSTRIIIIDPATGKVENYIECQDLVPENYKDNSDKVLNGIAYNPTNGNLYITGKYWPVLYEIKLHQ